MSANFGKVRPCPSSVCPVDRKWTRSGLEVDWKWTGSGPEVDQKCNARDVLAFSFLILCNWTLGDNIWHIALNLRDVQVVNLR